MCHCPGVGHHKCPLLELYVWDLLFPLVELQLVTMGFDVITHTLIALEAALSSSVSRLE